MLAVDRQLKPTNDKQTYEGGSEGDGHTHSVANLATFSLDLETFQTLLATLFLKSD